MSTQSQVLKFGATVLQNLPEMSEDVMQGWIENPLALQRVLRSVLIPPRDGVELKAWKIIKLGTGPKTADDFRKAIKDCGMKISDWANSILGRPEFRVAAGETEVDLVKVTVAELGFKEGATREQIYARAKELGLEICPPEVGPQLRLQYKGQPMNEWLLIGMESVRDSDGALHVFYVVRHASGFWLDRHYGSPDYFWPTAYRWVFVLPRKYQ